MEQPFYGRSGLLSNPLRNGLPIHHPRRVTKSGEGPAGPQSAALHELKWRPNLLTVPQRLLNYFRDGDRGIADPTWGQFLWFATVTEATIQCLVGAEQLGSGEDRSSIRRTLLQWSSTPVAQKYLEQWNTALRSSSSAREETAEWLVPSFKLITFKDGAVVGSPIALSRQSVTLLGKDAKANDIVLAHPSCSGQHAALQVQFVYCGEEDILIQMLPAVKQLEADPTSLPQIVAERVAQMLVEEAQSMAESDPELNLLTSLFTMEVQLVDLGSTNKSAVNGLPATRYSPISLVHGDVLTFGASTRQYVVMRNTDGR